MIGDDIGSISSVLSEYFVFVMTTTVLFHQYCRDVINSVGPPTGFDFEGLAPRAPLNSNGPPTGFEMNRFLPVLK